MNPTSFLKAIAVLEPLIVELAKYMEGGTDTPPSFLESIPNPLRSEVALRVKEAQNAT